MGFLKAVDILSGKAQEPQSKVCSCGCGKPLDPRVDGERPTIGGKVVREGCYYDAMGDEIERRPIGGFGIRRI